MTLSLPRSRQQIRKQDAVAAKLKNALKANGFTRKAQRERLIDRAKAGRPENLHEIALKDLAEWRREREVQKNIDMIAGRG